MTAERPPSLQQALLRYVETLLAATVPCGEGRQIPDVFGALVLSRAADELFLAILETWHEILGSAVSVPQLPPFIQFMGSNSPNGPWEPIPPESVRTQVLEIRKDDPRNAIIGALHRVTRAIAFPVTLWNALQSKKPGGDHNRYRAGDVIPQSDLELAASAERLINLQLRRHAQIDSSPSGRIETPQSEVEPIPKPL